MKTENQEYLTKITELIEKFGKDFALGYAFALIQQNNCAWSGMYQIYIAQSDQGKCNYY